MIDFYEELNLDENDSLSAIQDELDRLEIIWQRRLTSNLEAAQKKLDIIEQALRAFESEESKRKYDKALYDFKHPKVEDPGAKRKENFNTFKQKAENFYARKSYDLAKDAAVKAIGFLDDEYATADFYKFVSDVYKANKDMREAFNYINKAILVDEKNPKYYYYKAQLFIYQNKLNDGIKLLETTEEFATKKHDSKYLGLALDELARIYYYKIENGYNKGYEYAKRAVAVNSRAYYSCKIIKDVKKNEADERERAKRDEAIREKYEAIYALYQEAKSKADFEEIIIRLDNEIPNNYDPKGIRKGCKDKIKKIGDKKFNRGCARFIVIIILLVIATILFFVPMHKAKKAEKLVNNGEYRSAMLYADKEMDSYKDYKLFEVGITPEKVMDMIAKKENAERVEPLRRYSNTVVIYYKDGTVKLGYYKDVDLSKWDNIEKVYGYDERHILGLKKDGTVVAKYLTDKEEEKLGQCDVSNFKNIESLTITTSQTIGLRKDGTVIAVGDNTWGQCEVSSWRNIKKIYTNGNITVGLRKDGTVVSTKIKKNTTELVNYTVEDYNQYDVSNWEDIVSIALLSYQTVGLKSDGTLVVTMPKEYNSKEFKNDKSYSHILDYDDIKDINNVVMIDSDSLDPISDKIVCLKSDGTVDFIKTKEGDEVAQNWDNVVSIKTWYEETIALMSDGSIEATGVKKKYRKRYASYYKVEDFEIPEAMKNNVKF